MGDGVDPHSDPATAELTPEERVRSNRRYINHGRFDNGSYWVQFYNGIYKLNRFIYGDTPEETWNKALVHLITNRLLS